LPSRGASSFISNVVNGYGLRLNRAAVTNYNGISHATGGAERWFVGMRENLSSNNYIIYNEATGVDALTINTTTSAATFSSTLKATEITAAMPSGNGALYINNSSLSNKNWTFIPNTSSSETDLLLFYTGSGAGTRMTITSSGNVGINQTNPTGRLEVVPENANGNEGIFVNQLGSRQSTIRFKSAHSSSSDYRVGASITVGSAFEIYSIAAAASRLVITSGGNVLIGTTTDASYKLDVNGVTRSSIAYKIGTYTQGTTTPSVSNVSFMIISNSSSTTISNFTNAVDGQILTLLFTDSNTTINRVNAYLLNGANYTSGPNDTIKLIYSSGLWYEISRSSNA